MCRSLRTLEVEPRTLLLHVSTVLVNIYPSHPTPAELPTDFAKFLDSSDQSA